MARGVRGRERIVAYFSEQIPIRRAKGGEDLFSHLCQATHEDGALLSTQDIVDHMSFLMMAAHDTLTSSLTSFVGALAAYPQWQNKLREEVKALGIAPANRRPSTISKPCRSPEMAFKEAMRMKPPVPSIPRRTIRDLTFKGYAIPAGAMVGVNPLFTHHMPEIWPDPETFDPLALYRRGAAPPASLCLGAVRRRRAYVPRPAFRLYAGEMLRPAFPAESQRLARSRLLRRTGRCGRSRSRATDCG